MGYSYKTEGVCSSQIRFSVTPDDIIEWVEFEGGCSGNAQGVAILCQGMKVADAISRLQGIRCGYKNTSCPDQLARALQLYLDQHKEK